MRLPAVALVLVALGLLVRRVGGTRRAAGIERVYVAVAALPFVLAIVVPLAIGLALGFGDGARAFVRTLNRAAIASSLLLGAAGVALVARAVLRGDRWGWPLGVMTVVAGTPAALVLLTDALYWLAARL